jgi:hypothetical protein
MGKRYQILVFGKQRRNVDPSMLAQVLILVGQRLARKRQHRGTEQQRTSDTTTKGRDVHSRPGRRDG